MHALFDGIASQAKLAVFDIGDRDGQLFIPVDLERDLFAWSYAAGARVHSDSWGGAQVDTSYTDEALRVDRFMRAHEDFLVVIAAGNDGERGHATVSSPATAKNALTQTQLTRPKKRQLGNPLIDGFKVDFSQGQQIVKLVQYKVALLKVINAVAGAHDALKLESYPVGRRIVQTEHAFGIRTGDSRSEKTQSTVLLHQAKLDGVPVHPGQQRQHPQTHGALSTLPIGLHKISHHGV
jgi:hypothetical protein